MSWSPRCTTSVSCSAAKVSGTRIQTGLGFGVMVRNTGITADKTLTCKAFVKRGRAPVCVYLPRRFLNLSIIEEFLNVVNSSDAHPVDGQIDDHLALRQSSALKIPDDDHRRT
ncbi:hypothetical protein GQ54DRAFT_314285 [Martensiomyces pterosporus]|nr:hypothetical protein GQ54DRAFT_314285 [Martensiomyces pterosporus]